MPEMVMAHTGIEKNKIIKVWLTYLFRLNEFQLSQHNFFHSLTIIFFTILRYITYCDNI